jgi:DNA-directed RNA polymerase subunit N (RpoN/RPB10)
MIIPIRCGCGKILADKHRYYQEQVIKRKIEAGIDINRVIYLTSEQTSKTPEGVVMDELNLTALCCRRTMLTHVDI